MWGGEKRSIAMGQRCKEAEVVSLGTYSQSQRVKGGESPALQKELVMNFTYTRGGWYRHVGDFLSKGKNSVYERGGYCQKPPKFRKIYWGGGARRGRRPKSNRAREKGKKIIFRQRMQNTRKKGEGVPYIPGGGGRVHRLGKKINHKWI